MEKHQALLKPNLLLRTCVLFVAMLVGSVALSSYAHADEAADARQAATLYREGRYDEASVIYARLSVNYPENTTYLWNLGACYYYSIRADQAISTLRQYLNQDRKATQEEKDMATRWIAEMENRKRVTGAPVPVDQATTSVAASENSMEQGHVHGEMQKTKREESRSTAVILGSVGAAGLVTGIVCTVVSQGKFSATEKQYDADAESSGKTFSTLAFIGYGVGLAGLATAAVMYFGRDAEPRKDRAVAVTPLLTASAAGVSFSSRF